MHANARLSLHGRRLLVRRVRADGRPISHVAQLADTDIEVLERAPPGVATELRDRSFEGQMSLEDFCDEVIDILGNQSEVEEVLVAGVRPLRNAEADGTHRDLLAALSAG